MQISVVLHKNEIITTYSFDKKTKRSIVTTDIKELESTSAELISILQAGIRANELGLKGLDKLEKAGESLAYSLFSSELISTLRTSSGKLYIEMDKKLFFIPWELIYTGDSFLALQFDLGRGIIDDDAVSNNLIATLPEKPKAVIIVSDPLENLQNSQTECDKIFSILEEWGFFSIRIVVDPPIKKVKTLLLSYDLVHFIGHSRISSEGIPGWLLSDGLLLSSDIKKISNVSPLPFYVFSSACPGVLKNAPVKGNELAKAFIEGGTQHYLGLLWDLPDKHSIEFISIFYDLITKQTIGNSVRTARKGLSHKGLDFLWPIYFSCGDPDFNFNMKREQSAAVLALRADIPWKNIRSRKVTKKLNNGKNRFILVGVILVLLSSLIPVYFLSRKFIFPSNKKIELFVDKDFKREYSGKIVFSGITGGDKSFSNDILKQEQCIIKHLTYLPGSEIMDGRNIHHNTGFIDVSGKIIYSTEGPKVFITIHRIADNVILYVDEYYLQKNGEEQCIKMAEWIKRRFEL